jgi:beta-phosphoglucomutase-like phosphatase (HAD superfamily)
MDGVLVDSESVITEASIRALKEWGVDAKASDFHEFTGMGEDRFIGGVAEKHGVPYTLDMKRRAYEIYLTIVEDMIGVYPATMLTLQQLNDAGLPCSRKRGVRNADSILEPGTEQVRGKERSAEL